MSIQTTTTLSLNISSVVYDNDFTATINVLSQSGEFLPAGNVNLYYSNYLVAGPVSISHINGTLTSSAEITVKANISQYLAPRQFPFNLFATFEPTMGLDFQSSTSNESEIIVTKLDTILNISSSHPTGALTTDNVTITVVVDASGSLLDPTGFVTLNYDGMTTESVDIQEPNVSANGLNSAVFVLNNLSAEIGKTITAQYTHTSFNIYNSSSANFYQDVSEPAPPSNSAPTDIQLSSLYINELSAVGTVVGTLSTTDPDASNNFTYSLVGGTGSTDIASFDISGNLLITKESFVHAIKSSYAIRVRSTDQDNATYEEAFTILVQELAPVPGSTGAPFGITGGNVSSEILEKANASTFQFTDPQTGHTQESAIYFTNSVAHLSLGTLSASGPQVKVLQAPTNYRFIFSSYSDSTKNDLGLSSKTAAFVLKVIDASGNIQNNVSLTLELYLDVSGGSVVNLDINGTPAGSGTLSGTNGSKYIYTTTFTNGSGSVGATVIPSNPSAGSDPHITTIFGRRYDFHPSTRRNYTLFKSKDMKVSSHFTGLKTGVFYDKVMIDLPNKEQVKVDFNKQNIKGKSSFVSLSEEALPIQYKNITSDKSVGKIFEPKKMTKLSVAGNNPVDLFVDFNTRYVHFRFPDTLPVPSEMSGLIVEPATRLD